MHAMIGLGINNKDDQKALKIGRLTWGDKKLEHVGDAFLVRVKKYTAGCSRSFKIAGKFVIPVVQFHGDPEKLRKELHKHVDFICDNASKIEKLMVDAY